MTDSAAMRQLLMEIASSCINLSLAEAPDAIRRALGRMGAFISADRAYVFDYDFERQTCSNTYEWCGEGIEPQLEVLQDVPVEGIHDWLEVHRAGRTMVVPDVSALPPGALREILEPQGILSLVTVPMRHGGELLGFVGFDAVRAHHDYTEAEIDLLELFAEVLVNIRLRVRSDEELRASRDRLEAANLELARAARQKDDFLASVSHELRTPLGIVLGMAKLLREESAADLGPEAAARLETLEASAERLSELVGDMIDVVRLDGGKVEAQSEACFLSEVGAAAVRGFRRAADAKAVTLSLSVAPRGLVVESDRHRLLQVLRCLLSNAVKFTPRGGKAGVEITGEPQAGVVRVVVWDTGIGVPAAWKNRLFEDQGGLTGPVERSSQGIGLGTALVRRLVRLLGATISVESEPGRGTRLTLTLPGKVREDEPVEPGAPGEAGPSGAPAPDPAGQELSAVPEALRASLRSAVRRADLAEMNAIAEALETTDAAAAAVVRRRVESFDYEGLLALLGPEEPLPA